MSPRNIGSLEPPVTEELGVEGCYHHALAILRLTGGDVGEQVCKMIGVPAGAIRGGVRVVGLLLAQVDAGPAHPPELESAGPAHLVEFEVPLVAGIALEPAPDLHRGFRVSDVGGHRPVGHSVGPIGRAQRLAGNRSGEWGVDRRIAGRIAREAQRSARCGEMGVDEEELKAGIGQMLLDPAAHSGLRCRRPRLPRSSRPVGAFGQPAAVGRSSEYPAMLGNAHRQLQPDAFVSGEQREVAVSGRRADDLDPACGLEGAEGADDVLLYSMKQLAEPESVALARTPPEAADGCHRSWPGRPEPRRTP